MTSTDIHHPHPPEVEAAHHPQEPEEFDQDLDLKAIIWTGVGVAVMTIVSALLMLLLMRFFNHADAKSAAAVPAPPQLHAPEVAPEPRLQPSAREDMDGMLAREKLELEHAAWVDPKQGTVRLPIDVAIDVIAAQGLPRGTATGASTSVDRGPTNQVSPGTVLPGPGQGVGQLGPSAAAPGSQSGATSIATDLPEVTRAPLLATPATSAPPSSPSPPPPPPGRRPPGERP
jgi:hypothetical protein